MITLHFKTDKTNKSNYNTFVCLKKNGAVLIGESCQESDKKKRKEWKEKLLKDYLRHCIFEYVCETISSAEIAELLNVDEQSTILILNELDTKLEIDSEQLSKLIDKVILKLIAL